MNLQTLRSSCLTYLVFIGKKEKRSRIGFAKLAGEKKIDKLTHKKTETRKKEMVLRPCCRNERATPSQKRMLSLDLASFFCDTSLDLAV